MNNLTIKGKTNLFGIEIPNVFGGFGDNQKVMLAKTIAEIHGKEVREINQNINMNRNKFTDGVHLIDLKGNKEIAINLIDSEIMTQNAINASTNIYLLSQRGYVRLLKIMDDDTAWQKWDVIENEYFEMKENKLTPMSQLEILAQSAQILLEQDKAIKQLAVTQVQQAEQLQGMRDVISLNPHDWRKDTSNLINKMAVNMGGYEHVKPLRAESYKFLDERFGVDLQCRLTNKRRRMADEGVCKSKRDKLNQLDVIADDKKLIEGYVAIIKEMAIKYGA